MAWHQFSRGGAFLTTISDGLGTQLSRVPFQCIPKDPANGRRDRVRLPGPIQGVVRLALAVAHVEGSRLAVRHVHLPESGSGGGARARCRRRERLDVNRG